MNGIALRQWLGRDSGVPPWRVLWLVAGVSLVAGGYFGSGAFLPSGLAAWGPWCFIATLALALCGLAVSLSWDEAVEPTPVDEAGTVLLHEANLLKMALDKHAMVSITDADGRIISVNDRFCAISRYSREELIGQYHLRFGDNGVGLPKDKDLDWRKANSLGLQLVNLLTRQLDGTIEHLDGNGAGFHIAFPDQAQEHNSPS